MRRRSLLGMVGLSGAVALAGCALLEDELEREAAPAGIGEDALEATGYEHNTLDSETHSETLEVSDQAQDVRLTNRMNRYTAGTPGIEFDASRVTLFTTPTVSIAGQAANPFRVMDKESLIEAMVDRLDIAAVEGIEHIGERPLEIVDHGVTISTFEAHTEYEGATVDIHIDIGELVHQDDLLVPFGLYPALLDQSDEIDTLYEAIVHPDQRFETA